MLKDFALCIANRYAMALSDGFDRLVPTDAPVEGECNNVDGCAMQNRGFELGFEILADLF